jgi:hypothetical protein
MSETIVVGAEPHEFSEPQPKRVDWLSQWEHVRGLIALCAFAWLHRGGRKCGPNCHCEDYV